MPGDGISKIKIVLNLMIHDIFDKTFDVKCFHGQIF